MYADPRHMVMSGALASSSVRPPCPGVGAFSAHSRSAYLRRPPGAQGQLLMSRISAPSCVTNRAEALRLLAIGHFAIGCAAASPSCRLAARRARCSPATSG